MTDIGQPSTENLSTARELITLQPGGYANATLQISNAGNYSASVCIPVPATGSPSSRRTRRCPCTSLQLDRLQGIAKLLSVTAVRPGNGG